MPHRSRFRTPPFQPYSILFMVGAADVIELVGIVLIVELARYGDNWRRPQSSTGFLAIGAEQGEQG